MSESTSAPTVETAAGSEHVGSGHFARLFQHVLIYGVGRFGLQLFGLITLPILTRVFEPSDYGIIETIIALNSVVVIVATLALESAMQRSYYDYPEGDERRQAVVSTAIFAATGWATLLALAFALASVPLSNLLFGTDRHAVVLAVSFATIPLSVALGFLQEILRVRHQPLRYVVLTLFAATTSVGLVLTFVAVLDLGLVGYYTASVASMAPALVLGYLLVRTSIVPSFRLPELRTMLAYALPLVPVAMGAWVMQLADRLFLLRWSTLDELGRYALAVRLSNVLLFLVVAFGVAWSPFMLDLHSRNAHAERQIRARALTYVAAVLCFGALLVSVFAREIFIVLTTPEFEQAYVVVPLLAFGIVAIGFNGVTMSGISLMRRTKYFARYALYVVILNTALNFLLIPPFGTKGAAGATLLSWVALAGLYYRRAQQLDPVPFEVRRLAITVSLALALTIVGTSITIDPTWAAVLAKLPLVAAFPVLVWLLGGVDRETVMYLRRPGLILRRYSSA